MDICVDIRVDNVHTMRRKKSSDPEVFRAAALCLGLAGELGQNEVFDFCVGGGADLGAMGFKALGGFAVELAADHG